MTGGSAVMRTSRELNVTRTCGHITFLLYFFYHFGDSPDVFGFDKYNCLESLGNAHPHLPTLVDFAAGLCNKFLFSFNKHSEFPQADAQSAWRISRSVNLMMSEVSWVTPPMTYSANPLRSQFIFDCCKIIACYLAPVKGSDLVWRDGYWLPFGWCLYCCFCFFL